MPACAWCHHDYFNHTQTCPHCGMTHEYPEEKHG